MGGYPIEDQTWAVGSPHLSGRVDDTQGLSSLLPRVYIISDTRLFREGLMAMLTCERGLEVVGHGPCPHALQEIGNLAPDLALLDMGARDCLVIPRHLHTILPALRIVAVAVAEMETDIIACAEAGICGYVAQSGTVEDLVRALLRALTGELICSPRVAALLFGRLATLSAGRQPNRADDRLTGRERQIAELIARGLQNKEIARRLCLGHATVKNHVHNILHKMNIERRSELFGRHFDFGQWCGGGLASKTAASPKL
jgi:two-component system, NarL family, nitrate/nitrite response regulator NarL